MDLKIQDYICPGKRAHLVGVGGVSMSPLAQVLHGAGVVVTGSDMHESAEVAHLRALGIPVTIGHLPQRVAGADCVIRTAAVHDDNPEIAAARAAGIPVFERAQAWGALMRHYENALCVAGTHGKTTTTSMCAHIFLAAQRDPSIMIGGVLPALGAGHRVGHGDTIILESCEYCNSFLSFFPTVAVILNVDADREALLPPLCRAGARNRLCGGGPGRRQHHGRPGGPGPVHHHLRPGGWGRPRR